MLSLLPPFAAILRRHYALFFDEFSFVGVEAAFLATL